MRGEGQKDNIDIHAKTITFSWQRDYKKLKVLYKGGFAFTISSCQWERNFPY